MLRDSLLVNKTTEELKSVLAPKVHGVVNLDRATRHLALDYFALFSSIAGALGKPVWILVPYERGRLWWTFLDRADASPEWAKDVPTAQVRLIAALSSEELDARVRRIWGNVGQGTPEEKLATMRRFNNDLRAAPGNANAGMRVYNQVCARCHRLFGSGGDLGMDLTNANRGDRNYLLTQIVDPSVFIRKEYMTYEIRTNSGRVVSGLMIEQDAAACDRALGAPVGVEVDHLRFSIYAAQIDD